MWDVKRREKAHGVDPRWRKGIYKDLSVECPQRFRDINLHWHDLRHEYASRLVERGVPLAQVRDRLGHASILTTERYDNQRLEALQAAVERLKGGKTFDPQTVSGCLGFVRAFALTFGLSPVGMAAFVRKVSRIFQVRDGRREPTQPQTAAHSCPSYSTRKSTLPSSRS